VHDRPGERRRGGRAVARDVARLVGHLADELRAPVRVLAGQLDLARDRDAVVRGRGRAREPLEHDAAARGAERDLDRVGELVDAGLEQAPGLSSK